MKKSISFPVDNFNGFKIRMLNWAMQFNIFCLLDNSRYKSESSPFECLLGAGCVDSVETQCGKAFDQFTEFYSRNSDWIFGHFAYDLKNEVEDLSSENFDGIGFSDMCFFVPKIVVRLSENEVTIDSEDDPAIIFSQIALSQNQNSVNVKNIPRIQSRISRSVYTDTIKEIQKHILRGDCYEINFCQEFYSENTEIDPLNVYLKLAQLSPNPFSALYRWNEKYCICASPERYLKKSGPKMISQPIKGTAKRNLEDMVSDEMNKQYLLSSEKEKSENVMVVDLVRNDISKVCKEGTVKVDELFGVYSFPQVHQMISTVSGDVKPELHVSDIIKATFPMGSMTGAPKKSVMQLIEKYEKTRRGLFSGSIGYFSPHTGSSAGEAEFDFNVVIRSILYNAESAYLSFQTGSAVTFYSDAENEYEECLLKAAAIMEVLK